MAGVARDARRSAMRECSIGASLGGVAMGLFSKGGPAAQTAERRVPALGSGLHLTSALSVQSSLSVLDRALRNFRPPKYTQLPSFVYPGWEWRGQGIPAPTTAVSFNDRLGRFVLAALWPAGAGTVIGVFRLGTEEERLRELHESIVNDWRSQDPSLSPAGLFDSGLIALAPPVLPANFLDEILLTYGFSPTPNNLAALAELLSEMFVSKASDFIGTQDRVTADRFIREHRPRGVISLAFLQATLNDVAQWNSQVLPYIQELPMRCRAIILDGEGLSGICE